MKEIINVSKQVNKQAKKLWLDNKPSMILLDEVQTRYNITPTPYDVKAVIGEYDAPELQEQGIVTYSPIEEGNLLICGTEGAEREQVLNAIIYSISSFIVLRLSIINRIIFKSSSYSTFKS